MRGLIIFNKCDNDENVSTLVATLMLNTLAPPAINLIVVHIVFFICFPDVCLDRAWLIHFWPLAAYLSHVVLETFFVSGGLDAERDARPSREGGLVVAVANNPEVGITSDDHKLGESIIPAHQEPENSVCVPHLRREDRSCLDLGDKSRRDVSQGSGGADSTNFKVLLKPCSVVLRRSDILAAETALRIRTRHHYHL